MEAERKGAVAAGGKLVSYTEMLFRNELSISSLAHARRTSPPPDMSQSERKDVPKILSENALSDQMAEQSARRVL